MNTISPRDIQIVIDQTGVEDEHIVRETLNKCGGNIVDAISFILFPDHEPITTKHFEDLSDVEKLRTVMGEKEQLYHVMMQAHPEKKQHQIQSVGYAGNEEGSAPCEERRKSE